MASPAQSVQRSFAASVALACRRLLCCAVVVLGALVVVQALAVEAHGGPQLVVRPSHSGLWPDIRVVADNASVSLWLRPNGEGELELTPSGEALFA